VAFPLEGGYIPLPRAKVSVGQGDNVKAVTVVHGPTTTFVKGTNVEKKVPPRIPASTTTSEMAGDDDPSDVGVAT